MVTNTVNFKRNIVLAIIVGLFVLGFLVIKAIAISIIFGVLFAYVFSPLYKWLHTRIQRPNLSAILIILAMISVIALPIVYLTPVIVTQTFEMYNLVQNYDFTQIFDLYVDADLSNLLAIRISEVLSGLFTFLLTSLQDLAVNLPSLLLQFVVFAFTFYYSLRDQDKLKKYISSLSPFSSSSEKRFSNEFRGVTNSIMFGQVLIGLAQGLAVGIGLFVLGIENALILTLIASIVSIIPILGSWLVWLPVGLIQIASGNLFAGVFMLIYGGLFVSSIDNFVRPYLLSRQTSLPVSVSIIGTIGGLYFFGIAGLVLGPLILAYVMIILELYRHGKLEELFRH